ncbi:MarR family winged helix-turn-helix transcriptional regulator [Cnuibacter sp. UC19_7]|uniref:MarR family winged helix-turn-helix transcriptional regulator n=1 Tax=Cnuibacter sp. UC19_7 TaxID=3350166 RepID=UPI0036717C22
MDAEHEEAVGELTRAVLTISDHLWKAFAETDEVRLSGLSSEVIRVVVETPGVTLIQIAERLGKFPSNVSTALRDLTERGLVERVRDDTDRRVTRLYPSTTALHGVRTVYASWNRLLAEAVDTLTAAETRRLLDAVPALSKIQQHLGTAEQR